MLRKHDPDGQRSAAVERARQLTDRQQRIAAGLADLERWLENMIRNGLTDPQIRSADFWEAKADRMMDAKAPGIAAWLRLMAQIPDDGLTWIEPLLDQMGRLYLLIESFKRFDALPLPVQADMRAVIGWHLKPDEFTPEDVVSDRWLIIGRHEIPVNEQTRMQRLWLRGKTSERPALVQEFVHGDAAFATSLKPGWTIDADLVYFPSRSPLRAYIARQRGSPHADHEMTGTDIPGSIASYSAALARNPWLEQYPFLLDAVVPTRFDGRWVVRAVDGMYLPLAYRFNNRWALFALSGGHPLQIAGEWDGGAFLPLGVLIDDRFIDLYQIESNP